MLKLWVPLGRLDTGYKMGRGLLKKKGDSHLGRRIILQFLCGFLREVNRCPAFPNEKSKNTPIYHFW